MATTIGPKYKKGQILLYKERNNIFEILSHKEVYGKGYLYTCKYLIGDDRYVNYYENRLEEECADLGKDKAMARLLYERINDKV